MIPPLQSIKIKELNHLIEQLAGDEYCIGTIAHSRDKIHRSNINEGDHMDFHATRMINITTYSLQSD